MDLSITIGLLVAIDDMSVSGELVSIHKSSYQILQSLENRINNILIKVTQDYLIRLFYF